MANVVGPHFLRWDTVSGAVSPFRRTVVSKIQISCPLSGAGGVTTLTSGGKTIFSEEIQPGSLYDIDYAEPMVAVALTATAIGTNCVVHIEVV